MKLVLFKLSRLPIIMPSVFATFNDSLFPGSHSFNAAKSVLIASLISEIELEAK